MLLHMHLLGHLTTTPTATSTTTIAATPVTRSKNVLLPRRRASHIHFVGVHVTHLLADICRSYSSTMTTTFRPTRATTAATPGARDLAAGYLEICKKNWETCMPSDGDLTSFSN